MMSMGYWAKEAGTGIGKELGKAVEERAFSPSM